jgi:aromatic ring-cleaving dioxygenase
MRSPAETKPQEACCGRALCPFTNTSIKLQDYQIQTMATNYPSLLKEYEHLGPLSKTTHQDGKGQALDGFRYCGQYLRTSAAYRKFPAPITIDQKVGGFDAHILFQLSSSDECDYAKQLHTRIRYEFPELRIYTLFEEPAGPFTGGSFEVSLQTPEELGVFLAWLVVYRGPLSVLIHPNTDTNEKNEQKAAVEDHTTRAIWLGEKMDLDLDFFTRQERK